MIVPRIGSSGGYSLLHTPFSLQARTCSEVLRDASRKWETCSLSSLLALAGTRELTMRRFCEFSDALKSTLLVLRTWLEGGDEHWSRELLSSIREFARSIGGSDTIKAVVQEITNLANEKVCVTYHDSLTCTSHLFDCLPDECRCRISHSVFTTIAWKYVAVILSRTVQTRRHRGLTYSNRGRVLQ